MTTSSATAPWSFQELQASLHRDLTLDEWRRSLRAETETRVLVEATAVFA